MKLRTILLLLISLITFNAIAFNVKVMDTEQSFFQQKHVANIFGCKGPNQLPNIKWNDLPKGTKYIAITIYDKDAPTGGGFWHWLITDIPANKFNSISKADYSKIKKSGAIETINSYGKVGYGGPCPPKGDTAHRYIITAFALKDKLNLSTSTQPSVVGFMLNNKNLAKATAIALYKR